MSDFQTVQNRKYVRQIFPHKDIQGYNSRPSRMQSSALPQTQKSSVTVLHPLSTLWESPVYRPLLLSLAGVAVCTATRYGLDGPGIESRWGRDFPQTGPEAYLASYTTGTGVKRPGRGINHPTPYSAEVKDRIELYLYSLSGPSWPVLGQTLPFYLCYCP
jgi:hypothetical protein